MRAACASIDHDQDVRSDFCSGFHSGEFFVIRDPFLVFMSNKMALLDLRSLYFALTATVDRFRYLKSPMECFWC
jgi:hypothetical protein